MPYIQGTAASEALAGTSGDDVITGGGGSDRIEGGRGDDVLTGSDDGNDLLFGEGGDDSLDGGAGADSLYGGIGDDVVHGGDGNDYLETVEKGGSDILHGDEGDDYFRISRTLASFGALQAFGGAGADTFQIDVRTGSTIALDGGDGDDVVNLASWDAAATVTLGAGRDLLALNTVGTYTGTTSTGVTVTDFQAGAGGDVLEIAQALAGGTNWNGAANPFAAGYLRLTQSGADTILDVSTSANGSFVRAFVFKNVLATSFTAENFAGLSPSGAVDAPVVATGTDNADVLAGGSGDDSLSGGAGRDQIWGGAGADTLAGGDDADRINGGSGNDVVDGGAGADSLAGGYGDDVLHGGAGNDFITDNDTGTDILFGDEGNDQLWVQRGFDTGGGVTLYGGEGDDGLYINTYNSDPVAADGGLGNDRLTIYTLSGSVTATLGDGADVVDLGSWTKAAGSTAAIVVTDFATGAGGDRLEWAAFLARNATGLAADANPFATGHARLLQSGGDVLLQLDGDGGANGFVTLVTFQNRLVADFAAFNLGGFRADGGVPAPVAVTGGADGESLFGDGGADPIDGSGGDDVIYGLAGADTLSGGADNDILRGGMGDDRLDGGDGDDDLHGDQGSDTLTGGAGDDYLNDVQAGGSDLLLGGAGADTFYVERFSGTDTLILGGGDDADRIYVNMSAGTAAVDAGAGDDFVAFYANKSTILTLGAGADTISFQDLATSTGTITITDFQGGAGGDRFDWDHWLATQLTNFLSPSNSDPNPFATGHFKLVQSGADTILQLSKNGAPVYTDWIVFKSTDIWSLTAANLDGHASPYAMTIGTSADETFQGGAGNDGFEGGGGNDRFLIGYGGTDRAVGAEGNDSFFVALTATAATHQVTGAGGNDLLQLQGHGALTVTIGAAATSGTLIQATGIETIQLLAGADTGGNWGGGAAPAYTLTLKNEATAAGATIVVDASGLVAGESLKFSTDEADSALHLTGGGGGDSLKGGALGDLLAGGSGNDTLEGRGGNDVADGGDGDDVYNYVADPLAPDLDIFTGGAGVDLLSVSFSTLSSPAALTYSITPDGYGGYFGWFASGPDHRVEFTGVERFGIDGTAVGDVMSGGDGDDSFIGYFGDDIVYGRGGDDFLIGEFGIDTLYGGTGDDYYLIQREGSSSTQHVVVELEGEGIDEVHTDYSTYVLPANVEILVDSWTGNQTLTGNALDNLIMSSIGNDVIDGGAGADQMSGGDGNDIYYVDNVGDSISEGSGSDEIRTTLAAYTIGATLAVETLTGLLATGQSLTGNSAGNTIRGGGGDDVLAGAGGNDTLWGGAGNDQLDGGIGNDVMRGEQGDDVYTVDSTTDSVLENAGEGTDKVLTALSTYTLGAFVENLTGTFAFGQTLRGNALDNVVTGGAGGDSIRVQDGGADKVFASGGGDIVYFGAAMTAADQADGGDGSDTLVLQGSYSAGLTFNANALVAIETLKLLSRTDTFYGGQSASSFSYNLTTLDANVAAGALLTVDASGLSATEGLDFNGKAELDGRFAVTGGLAGDTLSGGAGADSLSGGGGNDFLDGGAGGDTMTGGAGNDIYIVDNAGDVVSESPVASTDEVRTALAAYTVAPNIEVLRGTNAAGQQLTGGFAGLTIYGAAGNDLLDDGGATATLQGGLGDDVYAVRAAGTQVFETAGEGTDTVRSYVQTFSIFSGIENLVGMLSTGQILVGHSGANSIIGGAGADRLDGAGGADVLAGGLGGDFYVVDTLADTVIEAAGEGVDTIETALAAFTLIANVENLTGTTNAGQTLTGNDAANVITAAGGNDLLIGLGGNDRLIGGGGTDTITYAGSAAGIVATVGSFYSGTVTVGPSETDTFDGIEKIVGTDFADTFINNSTVPASVMTFTGGAGDDVYRVGSTSDVIVEQADGGTDHVFAGATSYQLGANLEKLTGTAATGQNLFANALDNVVTGGAGNDSLRLQGGGADRGVGGAGSDSIYFGASFGAGDSVDGGSDYDVLLLKGTYSALSIGANVTGIESLELMSRTDSRFDGPAAGPTSYTIVSQGLTVAAGLFQVDGTKLQAGETLSFDGSAETGAAFTLLGGAAGDVLKGGALADTLDGGLGADSMAGGGGDDAYRVDNVGDVVEETVDGGADRVLTTLATYTLAANVEGLLGLLDTGQVLTGNSTHNSIIGGAGNDVIDGGGGATEYLDGMGGDDRILVSQAGYINALGGSGTDTLVVDYSGAGTGVTSFLDPDSYGYFGSVRDEAGRVVSFEGIDRFDITTGNYSDDVRTGAGDDRLLLGGGDDRAEAGGGNDQVEGGSGDDTLLGGGGDDRLDGGAGADSMSGGAGNDLYFADSADQLIENEGEGIDEVRTASSTFTLAANIEKLTATTGYMNTTLFLRGNALDNVVTTEVGRAVIDLRDGGADLAYGATNNDVFYFGGAFGAGDRVDGSLGTDSVVLQGVYAPLTLAAGTMIGIQTLTLLSAGDERYGGSAAGTYSYDITLAADFSSAIPMPFLPFIDEEGELVIDASGLGAGESLRFDGSAADPALVQLTVKGGAGADHLIGSAEGDYLSGGAGDDLLEGGAGDDYLDDWGGSSNVLRGGDGNDAIAFDSNQSGETLAIEAGDGNDWAHFYAGGAGSATIDMGAGDDRVVISHLEGGSVRVTLGAGQDVLAVDRVPFEEAGRQLGAIVVADFQAGAGGDRFEWPADLAWALWDWTPGTNPFAAGYARLVQSGADTLLQVRQSTSWPFATLVTFENRVAAEFTGENFGGWPPLQVTGGAGADQLHGTAASDFLIGEGGNDVFYLEGGGEDKADGGEGNDVVYFGSALSSGDVADGGAGRDAIVLQGNVTVVLNDSNLVGIESISIQSGANATFGDTANNFYDFNVKTADGNVLAGQQMIVNAQSLRAGEDFTFDGSAEHDGKFVVYGGHGTDLLKGGDGADVFFFEGARWTAGDKVDGGAGRDSVAISAGSGITHIEFAEDSLTNIESISVNNFFATDPSQKPSYELVLANGNVIPGGTLIVNGSSISGATQFVDIDGSAVHDGNLILLSGAGSDELIGGSGNDTLFAAGGADELTGGGGADTFRYDLTSESVAGAEDHILDFQSGTDKIDLSRIDADTATAGNQAFTWIGANAFHGVAGELRAFQSGGDWIVQGDTDGDGVADLVINVTTQGAAPLVQGDFLP